MSDQTTDHSTLPRLQRTGNPPETEIVHFGPGAFFRAFIAAQTEQAVTDNKRWGIAAVSLKSSTAYDQLQPQGGVFHSMTLSPESDALTLISKVTSVHVAPGNPEAVLQLLASAMVKIVTLTITEKGYCHQPASGELNLQHPDIAADLTNKATPRSAPGFLVAGLARRRDAGLPPLTIVSCDNIPDNGSLTQRIVLAFARQKDPALADWIEKNVMFPSTMVDRITPATTDDNIAQIATRTGMLDLACVVHEPFKQWVIEDRFVTERPLWENAGATFVESVEPHELMKLRCLNGTHSTLAYLGYLAGYDTIADTTADKRFVDLCRHLWKNEITPTVPPPAGINLMRYCDDLLARYQNTAIQHKTWQIAMDGSQKLPQRILGTVTDNLANGAIPGGLCLAIAGWMRYVGGVDEKGNAIDVRDPLADKLKSIVDGATDANGVVEGLLGVLDVFDSTLAQNTSFNTAVKKAYNDITQNGVLNTIESTLR